MTVNDTVTYYRTVTYNIKTKCYYHAYLQLSCASEPKAVRPSSRSIWSIISLVSGFNEISRRRFAIYKWYAVGMLRTVYTSREDIVLNTILAVVSHIEVSGGVISKLLFWSREKEKLRGKYPEVKLKVHHHNSTPAARLCLWQIPTWVTFLSFAHGVLRSTSFKPLCRPKNVSFLNEQIALRIITHSIIL